MSTLLQLLQKTTSFFEQKNVESPKLSAEHLFAHVLKCTRLDLFLRFEEVLSEDTLNSLRSAVKRRANHEPLQYIIGYVEFANCRLNTDSRALIPRPETEELVNILIDKYSANPPSSILDLGTGSGAIAIALAKAFPNAHITATDFSQTALDLAQENASINHISNISFILSDWFENVSGSFDWIISNPPYLTKEEFDAALPQVKDFEPKSALTPNSDGLQSISSILQSFRDFLTPNGLLALETGIHQHTSIQNIVQRYSEIHCDSVKDHNNFDRFFIITT